MGGTKKLWPPDVSASVTANRTRPSNVNGREGALKWSGGQCGLVVLGLSCGILQEFDRPDSSLARVLDPRSVSPGSRRSGDRLMPCVLYDDSGRGFRGIRQLLQCKSIATAGWFPGTPVGNDRKEHGDDPSGGDGPWSVAAAAAIWNRRSPRGGPCPAMWAG